MGQINVTNLVLKAWWEMLNGNISVPVYRVDAPASEEGNYLLLRVESETDNSNNSKFVTNPVIITEVVTKYKVAIKDGDAADIDSEVATLLFPSVGQLGLPAQSGIQITEVQRTNATYIPEDDGTFRYNRLITRNRHRVVQLEETLGVELITNGTFAGDATGWSVGNSWYYDTNKVSFDAALDGINELKQLNNSAMTEGARYRVEFDIAGSGGFVLARLANGDSQVFYFNQGHCAFDGTWSGIYEGFKIIFQPNIGFGVGTPKGSIDNVSVKEIL